MDLRPLQCFVKMCELRSMGRAAVELGVVTLALSQQISRLEGELSTRRLQRSSTGVTPTAAGTAFLHQALLTLRHAAHAVLAAQHASLSGHVGVIPNQSCALVSVLDRWCWIDGAGSMAVDRWRWIGGGGLVALDWWRWVRWRWQRGCGPVAGQ